MSVMFFFFFFFRAQCRSCTSGQVLKSEDLYPTWSFDFSLHCIFSINSGDLDIQCWVYIFVDCVCYKWHACRPSTITGLDRLDWTGGLKRWTRWTFHSRLARTEGRWKNAVTDVKKQDKPISLWATITTGVMDASDFRPSSTPALG